MWDVTFRAGLDVLRSLVLVQNVGLLMPPEVHKTIHPKKLLPGRLLVIGDVHGCIDELHELLDKVKYVEGQDNLIFTGDLGDKGPHSIKVRPFRHLSILTTSRPPGGTSAAVSHLS